MKGEEAKLCREKGLGPDVALFTKGTVRDKRAGGARDYGKGGGGDGKGFSGECFYCKRTGHRRRDCRSRIDIEGKGKKGSGGVDIVAQASGEKMWMTSSARPTPTSAEPIWFVDSGCSNHVTGNRDFFLSYTKFQPGERQVR